MIRRPRQIGILLAALVLTLGAAGCGGDSKSDEHGGQGSQAHGRRGGPGGGIPGGGRDGQPAAVPVEVAAVETRSISSFIETNGVLEAENEVDLVARTSAPIVELLAEEGMRVRKGQTLARLDQEELRTQMEISRVALDEARLTFDRAKELNRDKLISAEEFESSRADFESATAQLEANRIQFSYTEIKAPFDGLIVTRYVDFAEQLSVNTPLFRISDFDPLLCPIQVPERELSSLRVGQRAYVTLEPWPDKRFEASVLRLSPVVDAATGTIKVTLEVRSEDDLRPGMFARVYLETATRPDAIVVPKAALSLESIGDTVYVPSEGLASRREVTLGFREGDFVEIVSGVASGESVVVVGQDGLSDGTPIEVLGEGTGARMARAAQPRQRPDEMGSGEHARPGERSGPGPGRGRPDFASMSPEQLERAKEFMRARGMTEEQIAERIKSAPAQPRSEQP